MRHVTRKSALQAFELALREASLAETVAHRFAKTFPSNDALNKYLQKHPNADARSHSVAKPDDASDEDKLMKDLKSRAKHNKKQEGKPKEPAKPAKKEDREHEDALMKDLQSRAKHNKKQEKKSEPPPAPKSED
jgi:hypothetical protein